MSAALLLVFSQAMLATDAKDDICVASDNSGTLKVSNTQVNIDGCGANEYFMCTNHLP